MIFVTDHDADPIRVSQPAADSWDVCHRTPKVLRLKSHTNVSLSRNWFIKENKLSTSRRNRTKANFIISFDWIIKLSAAVKIT